MIIVRVSDVLSRIKSHLDNDSKLQNLWVQGETTNVTLRRGIYYFHLKDESSEISCVMYGTYASRLPFTLENGLKVLVLADANVYINKGTLQLYVRDVKPDGKGALYLEYEQRKKRLFEQGYFNDAHKKPKPNYIQNVAIITAPTGAAIHDVKTTIWKRWPMTNMKLFPCYVQGTRAAESMIIQLQKVDQQGWDAILLVRGGGSFEDLFCFNDEELVKAIYHCKTYIVTGIGHEVDTSLCDLASDYRAATPTAAAQWITWDQHEIQKNLNLLQHQMTTSMYRHIENNQQKLNTYKENTYLKDPLKWAIQKQMHLSDLLHSMELKKSAILNLNNDIEKMQQSLTNSINSLIISKSNGLMNSNEKLAGSFNGYVNTQKERLSRNVSLLDAYSPLKTLERGYSISTINHKVLHSIHEVNENDLMETEVSDGKILSRIVKKG